MGEARGRGQIGHGTGKVIMEAPMWGIISPFKGSPDVRGGRPDGPAVPKRSGVAMDEGLIK